MPGPEYRANDKFQRMIRDKILIPQLYEQRWPGFELSDGPEYLARQVRGVDTVLTTADGTKIKVDEKILRMPFDKKRLPWWPLEVRRSRTKIKDRWVDWEPSWMKTSQADWIIFVRQLEHWGVHYYIADFERLKAWARPRYDGFRKFGRVQDGVMKEGCLAPFLSAIKAGVTLESKPLMCPEELKPAMEVEWLEAKARAERAASSQTEPSPKRLCDAEPQSADLS